MKKWEPCVLLKVLKSILEQLDICQEKRACLNYLPFERSQTNFKLVKGQQHRSGVTVRLRKWFLRRRSVLKAYCKQFGNIMLLTNGRNAFLWMLYINEAYCGHSCYCTIDMLSVSNRVICCYSQLKQNPSPSALLKMFDQSKESYCLKTKLICCRGSHIPQC